MIKQRQMLSLQEDSFLAIAGPVQQASQSQGSSNYHILPTDSPTYK